MLRLYRRTRGDLAAAILKGGLTDSTGTYLTDREFSGVWLSDVPLDANEGADGDTVLEVLVDATEAALAHWEWVEEGKPYREWLNPAAAINPLVLRIRIVSDVP